jgi:hypothetical protein
VTKGEHVADLLVQVAGGEAQTIPLLAGENVAALSGFGRISAALSYYLHGKK